MSLTQAKFWLFILMIAGSLSPAFNHKCQTTCADGNGNTYAGSVNSDYMNFPCRHWDDINPDFYDLGTSDADFPCDGSSKRLARNYCRAINSTVPWCYTEFGFRERSSCMIPRCEPPQSCFSSCNVGTSYSGRLSVTRTGERCESWDSISLQHSCYGNFDDEFPCDGSRTGAKNYCRAPDGDKRGLWCYTPGNSTSWDYCDLPQCDRQCGSRYVYKRRRIIGGNEALYGEVPWQAVIMKRSRFGNWLFVKCGGTILDEWWIVTAAHCFRHARLKDFTVRVGSLDITTPDLYEQSFSIERLIIHQHFNANLDRDYDIALIKVKPVDGLGIKFSHIVQPACIATADMFEEVQKTKMGCLISGWGFTALELPNILNVATIPVMDDDVCFKLHGDQSLTERMFCAGFINGGVDACSSDSGGPLVCRLNGKYTLVGITSWGVGCARPNKPGVYTKVSEFHRWIARTIKEENSL